MQVKIKRILYTTGGHLNIHPKLPDIKGLKFRSYVAGIVNEIIWCSLAYNQTDAYHDPVSVYYRAYDRVMTGAKAEVFMKNDFIVSGFGVGTIRVRVDKDGSMESDRLKDSAIAQYMLPQFNIL